MSAAHTPAPWMAHKCKDRISDNYVWTFSASGSRLPLSNLETNNANECAANARLIAAAPELLEAAQAYESWADKTYCYDRELRKIRQMLRAAIKKATGE